MKPIFNKTHKTTLGKFFIQIICWKPNSLKPNIIQGKQSITHQTTIWSVYLIRTDNRSLYTGITTNIKRRFNEHKTQGPKCAKSLRGKGPLRLVFHQEIGSKSEALKLEHRIKKLTKLNKEWLVKTKKIPKMAE